MSKFTVKVQRPLQTPGDVVSILIYNQDRSIEWVESDPDNVEVLDDVMRDEPWVFMHAEVRDQHLALLGLAPEEDW